MWACASKRRLSAPDVALLMSRPFGLVRGRLGGGLSCPATPHSSGTIGYCVSDLSPSSARETLAGDDGNGDLMSSSSSNLMPLLHPARQIAFSAGTTVSCGHLRTRVRANDRSDARRARGPLSGEGVGIDMANPSLFVFHDKVCKRAQSCGADLSSHCHIVEKRGEFAIDRRVCFVRRDVVDFLEKFD